MFAREPGKKGFNPLSSRKPPRSGKIAKLGKESQFVRICLTVRAERVSNTLVDTISIRSAIGSTSQAAFQRNT